MKRVEEATAVVPDIILFRNQPFKEARSAFFELMSTLNGPKNPFGPAWEAYTKRKFNRTESIVNSQAHEAEGITRGNVMIKRVEKIWRNFKMIPYQRR